MITSEPPIDIKACALCVPLPLFPGWVGRIKVRRDRWGKAFMLLVLSFVSADDTQSKL